MKYPDGLLRAKWDGELSTEESATLDAEILRDPQLRERYEQIVSRAERAQSRLAELAPDAGADPHPSQAQMALSRLRTRHAKADADVQPWWWPWFKNRPAAWSAAAALVVLCGALLLWSPAAGVAQRILGLLRVQNVAVISFDPALLYARGNGDRGALFGELLSNSVTENKKPGPSVRVANRGEASEQVGFAVRLLGARGDQPELRIKDSVAFHLSVDRARVAQFLELAGRPDLELPAAIDGAKVAVDIPKVLEARYGQCGSSDGGTVDWTRCVVLFQGRTPTVVTIPEFDLGQIAELGLQVTGMTQQEAHSICQSIDWTSTLVIPLPDAEMTHQEVNVDGVKGMLINHGARRRMPAGYVLVWIKYGVVHALVGYTDGALALPLVESLD